jgi:hypothetical protein
MTNRDLLKEAIADAKAVKETAIANAKAALEETFVPFLREKLALKLEEMDNEENDELKEMKKEEVEENYESKNMESSEKNEMDEEMNLDELLKELDGLEEDKTINAAGWEDYNEDEDNDNHGNLNEGEDEDADGVPDDLDADIPEDMSTKDLEMIIRDVISDMVSAGELEAGHEGEDEGEEDKEDEENEEGEEEFSINELLAEMKKVKAKKTAKKVVKSKEKEEKEEKDEEKIKIKKDLKEAYDTLRTIKSELNEVNLFNAKLLYANKIFRSKNLSENQKVKVLAAFDKAVSIKEAKLVYETLSEGLKTTKAPVNESLLRGAASKASGIAPKKPILEVNNQFARMQKLAGIIK